MDETTQMIKDCQNWHRKMNEWEQEFVASIAQRHAERKKLSAAQLDKLEAIWEKVTK